ncbi:MAG: ATP-binding cassette domain-containing protein [Gaiellaceae bacterium]
MPGCHPLRRDRHHHQGSGALSSLESNRSTDEIPAEVRRDPRPWVHERRSATTWRPLAQGAATHCAGGRDGARRAPRSSCARCGRSLEAAGRRSTRSRASPYEIGAGESVALVGESGSGKTTLERCLLGLERPTSGEIVIDRVRADDYSALDAAAGRKLRRTIQIVVQDPYSSLNPGRKVGSALREVIALEDPRAWHTSETASALLARASLGAAARGDSACARAQAENHRLRRASLRARRLCPAQLFNLSVRSSE